MDRVAARRPNLFVADALKGSPAPRLSRALAKQIPFKPKERPVRRGGAISPYIRAAFRRL
jgi:hypothetical protein